MTNALIVPTCKFAKFISSGLGFNEFDMRLNQMFGSPPEGWKPTVASGKIKQRACVRVMKYMVNASVDNGYFHGVSEAMKGPAPTCFSLLTKPVRYVKEPIYEQSMFPDIGSKPGVYCNQSNVVAILQFLLWYSDHHLRHDGPTSRKYFLRLDNQMWDDYADTFSSYKKRGEVKIGDSISGNVCPNNFMLHVGYKKNGIFASDEDGEIAIHSPKWKSRFNSKRSMALNRFMTFFLSGGHQDLGASELKFCGASVTPECKELWAAAEEAITATGFGDEELRILRTKDCNVNDSPYEIVAGKRSGGGVGGSSAPVAGDDNVDSCFKAGLVDDIFNEDNSAPVSLQRFGTLGLQHNCVSNRLSLHSSIFKLCEDGSLPLLEPYRKDHMKQIGVNRSGKSNKKQSATPAKKKKKGGKNKKTLPKRDGAVGNVEHELMFSASKGIFESLNSLYTRFLLKAYKELAEPLTGASMDNTPGKQPMPPLGTTTAQQISVDELIDKTLDLLENQWREEGLILPMGGKTVAEKDTEKAKLKIHLLLQKDENEKLKRKIEELTSEIDAIATD